MKIYENGQLRDLTPKELEDIKAFEDEQKKIPNKPTLEEQILALQNALITSKISGGGIKVTDSSRLPVEEFSMSGKTEQLQTTGTQLFDWKPYLTTVGSKEQFKEKLSEGYTILRGVAVNTGVIRYGFGNQVVMCMKAKSDTQYFFGGYKKSNIVFLNDSLDVVGNTDRTTFLTTADTAYIVMHIFNYAQDSNAQPYTLSEIEKMNIVGYGTAIKPYEPYTGGKPSPSPDYPQPIETTPQGIITVDFTDGTNHQIVELSCPREFTKWDRLEKIDGVWNWVFGSRKETFEDASVKNMIDVSDKNARQFTVHHETDIKDAWSNAYVLSNNFIGVPGNKSYTQSAPYDFYVAYHNKDIVFSSKKFDGIFETKETFQEWLQSSGAYILHKSDEKELIPLSQSEQDTLNAFTMYAPNTEITNDGGCNMELTYTVDTKSYVDAKIAEVSTAVVQKGIENV